MTDTLRYVISLNSHGAFATDVFTLAADTYVLVPHPAGLDAPYLLDSPANGATFEQMLYSHSDGSAPTPSSGGWYLYRPGMRVRDMRFMPWSGSADPHAEYVSWLDDVPGEDVAGLVGMASLHIPAFALVAARDAHKRVVIYHGVPRKKVKVFGPVTLRMVLEGLRKEIPEGPIVLAPFACNASGAERTVTVTIDGLRADRLPAMVE